MEPIRYLQPATFPPPALQHNSKEIFRKRKCVDSCEPQTSSCQHSDAATTAHAKSSASYRQHQNMLRWSLLIATLMSVLQVIQTTPVFVDNPSLAQFQSGRNIRHLPCVARKSGLSGTCMFAIDCIKQNGTHLGTCIDRFYFGSCCQIKEDSNLFAPEISDNSIDQNTISHFVHETTTALPTSALYKPTTDSPQSPVIETNNSTSSKTASQSGTNKSTTSTTTSTRHTTTKSPSNPTSIAIATTITATTTTSNTFQTRRPTTGTHRTTHKPSQYFVRTTTAKTTLPATKKSSTTTKKPSSTTRTTTATATATATHKPSRRRPTTTTAAPILTTNRPVPTAEDPSLATSPPKLFTFQMVETTTPAIVESTNFVESTTTHATSLHTKRPQKPSKPAHTKPPTLPTNNPTSIDITTAKINPTTSIRNTIRRKPSTTSTPPTQKPSTTKKPSTNKRPKPSQKPTQSTVNSTATVERVRPSAVSPPATKPINLNDESSPTTAPAGHRTPYPSAPTSQFQTTHTPSTRPRPTAHITKVPKPASIPTINAGKKPTLATNISGTISTAGPKPSATTTKITETTTHESVTTSQSTTTASTTFKPGLITWTNEEAEPTTNITIPDRWVPPQIPAHWLPVSTIAPQISVTNKSETIRPAIITTTRRPVVFAPTASTEKIIVSIATSVSETQRNETVKPPKSTTSTTTTPTATTTTKPSSTTSTTEITATTEPKTTTLSSLSPSSTTKPTTATTTTTTTPTTTITTNTTPKPSLSTNTPTPANNEQTTIDYEAAVETTTENYWSTAPTGSSTTIENFTDTEDYNSTTSLPTGTTLPPNTLEGMDYRQVCGRRMFPEPRIVGGSNAAFGRWPWQISLRQWRTSTYLHKCGAALLNENWAITAAHCVDNVPPSDLLLRLGEYDLAEEEEPYGYQERRVQIVASHPQFDPRTFEYDLALLRFYEPVIFQPNIIPVCVPNSDEDFIGQTAFVTGWGRLYEDGPLPSVLQEVAVPVINNTICETMYRAAGYIEHIPHIFICAGWKKGGYDSCEGDSGGPMVIQREDDKRFQLGGVISWGIGCAEANQPGVYTRISEFRDWINQILQF